jgi:uncharacterized membrane protein
MMTAKDHLHIIGLCVLIFFIPSTHSFAFIRKQNNYGIKRKPVFTGVSKHVTHRKFHSTRKRLDLSLSTSDQTLAFWISAFSFSHVGMSALRQTLIEQCGRIATSLRIVGTGLKLPSYWPGDDVGKQEILQDEETAGRQLYRIGYTFISFATLGSALVSYLDSTSGTSIVPHDLSVPLHNICFGIAAVSSGASIASLVNPSPLSLVPGFTTAGETENEPILGLRRSDAAKLQVRGLTRITRHPLILPVVPWGIATSILAGGCLADYLLFAGLSVYAVCGCFAQDLRVIRQEGSVGTVFRPSSIDDTGNSLLTFFESTSFVPFGAILDGRQSMADVVRESPWLAFVAGCIAGAFIEDALLGWLSRQ